MTRTFALRLLESYFRHRWLNILPLALLVATGAGYTLLKPRDYSSQGLIYVPSQSYLATLTNVTMDPTSPWISPAQGTANEIKELLQTDSFIRSIIQKSDLAPQLAGTPNSVTELLTKVRKDVMSSTQGDNQVLVAAQYKNPLVAFQLASATIENYTQWRIDASLSQSAAAQSFFADLIPKYEAEVEAARQALNAYLLQHPAPLTGNRPDVEQTEIDRLKGDLDQAQARYTAALDKEENARLAASQTAVNTRQTLYVMDAPTIPDRPTTSLKQTALESGLFLVVGALLTASLVVGGAVLDRSFLFPIDVVENLELPVLATVPDSTLRRRRFRKRSRAGSDDIFLQPRPTLPPAFGRAAKAPASLQPASEPSLPTEAVE